MDGGIWANSFPLRQRPQGWTVPSSFKEQEKGIKQIRLRGGDGEVMEALAGYGKAVILCSEMGCIRAFLGRPGCDPSYLVAETAGWETAVGRQAWKQLGL